MVYNRKQFRYSIEILASDGLDSIYLLGIIRINIKDEIEFDDQIESFSIYFNWIYWDKDHVIVNNNPTQMLRLF